MTSNILRITTILFLFTAFPGQPAWAQGERGRREDPFDREEMIRRFDADGDGELNSAEREKMRDFILNSLQERPEGNRPPQPPQGAPGGRGAGPGRQDLKVVARFDKDGDGKLNDEERAKARVYVKEQGSSNRRRGRRPGGGGEPRERNPGKPEKLTPADVKNYPGKSLYDTSILRTIFIEFPGDDWETELADFSLREGKGREARDAHHVWRDQVQNVGKEGETRKVTLSVVGTEPLTTEMKVGTLYLLGRDGEALKLDVLH